MGLLIATLISVALVRIPIVGPYLTVPIYLLAGYFTAYLAAKKHVEILRLLGVRGAFEVVPGLTPAKLLDSSAIIDGRILEIIDTGFVEGELLVPRFVVEELQRLADSADAEKRVRGRRGLDFVKRLQNSSGAVRIDGADYADIEAVDAKLVRLAADTGAQIISTDYTLKKVAEIQGVKLLNVNDLANSVKPAVLAGRGHRSQDTARRARAEPRRRVPRRRHHDRRRGGQRHGGLARQGRGDQRAAEPLGKDDLQPCDRCAAG